MVSFSAVIIDKSRSLYHKSRGFSTEVDSVPHIFPEPFSTPDGGGFLYLRRECKRSYFYSHPVLGVKMRAGAVNTWLYLWISQIRYLHSDQRNGLSVMCTKSVLTRVFVLHPDDAPFRVAGKVVNRKNLFMGRFYGRKHWLTMVPTHRICRLSGCHYCAQISSSPFLA